MTFCEGVDSRLPWIKVLTLGSELHLFSHPREHIAPAFTRCILFSTQYSTVQYSTIRKLYIWTGEVKSPTSDGGVYEDRRKKKQWRRRHDPSRRRCRAPLFRGQAGRH